MFVVFFLETGHGRGNEEGAGDILTNINYIVIVSFLVGLLLVSIYFIGIFYLIGIHFTHV